LRKKIISSPKNNKAVIISQRIDIISNRNETRDSLDQELLLWIKEAGYLSVPLPNTLISDNPSFLEEFIKIINPIGIVLSGGNDIGEFKSRDETEIFLIKYAVKNKIPLIGICRGFQMLAKWDGGTLVNVDGHISKKHSLIINSGDWPNEIICYHKWGLVNETTNFINQAQTIDGSIEAIKHKKLPIEGWMWHPERNKLFKQIATNRMQNLFK
jgi:N5-(cytidine 5'-diphosphoramidyl)-L-glutamine hydrolase